MEYQNLILYFEIGRCSVRRMHQFRARQNLLCIQSLFMTETFLEMKRMDIFSRQGREDYRIVDERKASRREINTVARRLGRDDGHWVDIGDEKSAERNSQALRKGYQRLGNTEGEERNRKLSWLH